jgi:uncharacterized protein YoaH (UPF0181 family)
MVAEPEFVPMTDEQQQEAITVLSRLFAELLVNEEFMAFVASRKVDKNSDSDCGA